MTWRIEQAKTARSSCRHCAVVIALGEYRFGNDERGTQWFHLGCALDGKPRAFKPFAAEAARLLAKQPPPVPMDTTAIDDPRNLELEARFAAQPDDDEIRGVYADWLQSRGHPLGEIVALELAGKAATAKQRFKQHRATLTGGLAPKLFEWKRYFIRRVGLESRMSVTAQIETLATIFALPAAVIMEELAVPAKLEASVAELIGERIPPTVTKLFTWFTNAAANLALPHLTHLELFAFRTFALDPGALEPLFAARHLPKVTRLAIFDGPIAKPIVTALLDSQLIRQLAWLELSQGAVDAESLVLVRERARELAHIPVVRISGAEQAFPTQHQAWLKQTGADP